MRSQWTANLIYKNTDISVFLAGLNVPAKVYTAATGGSAISTLPQITSNSSGTATFYVDSVDYDLDQLFDIKVQLIGKKYTFSLENVAVFDILAFFALKEDLANKNSAGGYTGRDTSNSTTTYVNTADYGGNFSTYTPPSGTEGAIRVAVDTNATTPGKRLYVFANNVWSYAALT